MDWMRWVIALVAFALVVTSPCYAGDEIPGEWSVATDIHAILQTSDGGHIAVGELWEGDDEKDFWVVKISPEKTISWQKSFGSGGCDIAFSVDQTKDGGFIVAGSTESFGSGDDFWVLKLNREGNVQWQKAFGAKGTERARSAHETSDGGFIVTGTTTSSGCGWEDFWVLKLNQDGTIAWQRTYGGKDYDTDSLGKMPVKQTSDGGFILGGVTQSFGAGGRDFWVLKLNPDGNVAWQKAFGTSGDELITSIEETSEGEYVVIGSRLSSLSPLFDIRLDARGNIIGFKSAGNEPISVVDTSAVSHETGVKSVSTSKESSDTSRFMVK